MSDFNYLNARIRAAKTQLFDQAAYGELLGMESLTQVKNRLLDSSRGTDIQDGIAARPGAEAEGVELGLSKHLERTYRRLLSWAGDDARPLIMAILRRWDVHNIKTLLRGKQSGVPEEELLAACMPACDFSWDDLAELAKQPTLRDVVNLLLTWNTELKRPILKHQEALAAGGKEALRALEFALDSYYYYLGMNQAEELAADAEPVIYLLNMEADVANILTVLRLLGMAEHDRAESFLINGGHLGLGFMRTLLYSPTIGDALDKLKHTYLGRSLSTIEVAQPALAEVERALKLGVDRYALKCGLDDPLSIGVAIQFIWRKQAEFTNLRLIVKAKTYGFTRKQVEAELVHG